MLAEVGHDGKVLAGGQSLIPILNMRLASPAHLVDINRRRRPRRRRRDADDQCGSARSCATPARAPRRGVCRAAAPAPGARQRRPPRHPQPRHDGRLHRPRRRRRGDARDPRPDRRRRRGRRARRAPRDRAGRLLRGRRSRRRWRADELAVAVRFGRFAPGTAHGVHGVGPAPRRLRDGRRRRRGDASADGVVAAARASFVSVTDVPTVLDLDRRPRRAVEPGAADWAAAADAPSSGARHVEPEGDIHASADYRADARRPS